MDPSFGPFSGGRGGHHTVFVPRATAFFLLSITAFSDEDAAPGEKRICLCKTTRGEYVHLLRLNETGTCVMDMDDRARLQTLLVRKSCRFGRFTLTSGKVSDFYCDGKQTTLDAEGAWLCGRLLYRSIREHEEPLLAVGGMTLGADPLVTAVSLTSYIEKAPIPAFIVRKEAKGHGTGNFIEGKDNIAPGALVAVVEDVVTTGGTLLKVIDRVEAEGFRVGLALALLDREEGGAAALAARGCPFRVLFTKTRLMAQLMA